MSSPTTHLPGADGESYGVDDDELARINRSLTNITPSSEGVEAIECLRANVRRLAFEILVHCPPCRERSLALTHLEETTMWAVKSIVLAPPPTPPLRNPQAEAAATPIADPIDPT